MNSPNLETPKFNLNRKPGGLPLHVDMERFFEFSFWIAEELLDLEAQYRLSLQPVNGLQIKDDLRLDKSARLSEGESVS